MKTVIMAGGKGTRISSVAGDNPKPMIKIGGIPVLEHEIRCLKEQGFTDIILTVSHLGEKIKEYFGDGGRFGVHIEYYFEETPLGNAGALINLKDRLTADFLLLNADSVFDVDFNRFVAWHRRKGGLATLFTHPNSHSYDSGLIVTDENHAVTEWLTKEDTRPRYYKNRVNAGLHILSPELLSNAVSMRNKDISPQRVDLDRDLSKPLAGSGKMFAYDSPEYVKDMGTPERYETVCRDFAKGLIQARNLRRKQRAVFLDRDGTINRYVGFLRNIEDFELLPGVAKAIRRINELGYLAIVVMNQPIIARGEVTREQLQQIHNKMETLLGEQGAYLDGIYYCPHHPDRGYEGEISELKIGRDCRKPKPGLLLKAAEDFNIDLNRSWMVGDGENDILAGQASGCRTALLDGGEYKEYRQSVTADTLLAFAKEHLT